MLASLLESSYTRSLLILLPLPPQESSHCFWPGEAGDSEEHGKLTVKLLSVKTHSDIDIIIRKLQVVKGSGHLNKALQVTLLQLTSWPRQGFPHPTAVLSLTNHLTNAQMRSATRHTVIMCRSESKYKLELVFSSIANNEKHLKSA